MVQVNGSHGGSGDYHGPVVRHDADGLGGTGARILHFEINTASTKRDTSSLFAVFFGELENE